MSLNSLINASLSNKICSKSILIYCNDVQPRSVLKNRKSELDGILDDPETPPRESIEDSCHPNNTESVVEGNVRKINPSSYIANHIRESLCRKKHTNSMIFKDFCFCFVMINH
jgi:hypothetical protein